MLFFPTLNLTAESFDQARDYWQRSKDCHVVAGHQLGQVGKLNLLKEDRDTAVPALRERYNRLISEAEALAKLMAAICVGWPGPFPWPRVDQSSILAEHLPDVQGAPCENDRSPSPCSPWCSW